MNAADPEDLLLAYLVSQDGSDRGLSMGELVEGLGVSSTRLSAQIELASAVENLRRDGLVSEVYRGSDDPAFELTEQGKGRAREVHERIADVEIVVKNGTSRQYRLGEAAEAFDRSVVDVYTDLTDDGVYYSPEATDAPESTLVERESETEGFQSALSATREDRTGRAVVFTGHAGVGKTALVEAVLEDAREAGLDVVGTRCRGASEPYGPLRDCLADLDGPTPFDATRPDVDDPEAYRVQQATLFRDLTEVLVPRENTAGSPDRDRDRPGERGGDGESDGGGSGGSDGQRDVTGDGIRLLWFEDVHLADRGTTAYLTYLFERLADLPVLFVGTCRPPELTEGATDWLEAFTDDERVTRVELGPLTESGTRRLIEQTVGERGAPASFVEAVHERTGGNPLFVGETVERLLDRDELDPRYEWYPERPSEVDVPDAVTETLRERVGTLEEPAAELLRWAALVGQEVPLEVLVDVPDGPPDRLRRLVAVLVRADIFEWVDDGRAVTFRTAALQRALETDVDDATRRRRHAEIAAVLEARVDRTDDAGGQAERIASHYERAGEPAAAIEWYRRAGERARELYAHEDAIAQFHSALGLARDVGDEEAVLGIAEELAEIHLTTGDHDEAERYVGFVRERTDETARLQRAGALASELANARGEYETAVEEAEAGLALSEAPSEERVRLLDEKATAESFMSEYDRAGETTREQLETAERTDAPGLTARAKMNLGEIAWRRDDYDTAEEYLTAALETARGTGDRRLEGETLQQLGVVAWNRGEYERALDVYRSARDAFDAIGDRHRLSMVDNNIADVAYEQGRYDEAESAYRSALKGFRAAGNRRAIGIAHLNLGKTAVRRGAYDTARSYLEDAREELETVGVSHVAAVTERYLGEVERERGNHQRAREYLDSARRVFETVEDRHRIASTDLQRGHLARAEGDSDAARSWYEDALAGFRAVDAEQDAAGAKLALGRLSVETDDLGTAREYLSAAFETFDAADKRHERAKARLQIGRLAAERGELRRACDHWERAFEELEAVGAVDDALSAAKRLVDTYRDLGADDAPEWADDPAEWVERGRELADAVGDRGLAERDEWPDG